MQQTERIKKNKHDHKLTNLLKATLFTMVMLAPIFSIAVRCGYVMLNKNAYESYYGETINQKELTEMDNSNSLVIGNKYQLNSNLGTSNTSSFTYNIYFSNYEIITQTSMPDDFFNDLIGISFRKFSDSTTVYIHPIHSEGTTNSTQSNYATFSVIIDLDNTTLNFNYNDMPFLNVFLVEYNKYSYLDNAFDYSVNQLENESYISWTKNTGIYTGINAMTTGLDITNNALPMLLTYWALMTAIYIIFDIVIGIFTKLTHLLS